MKYILDILLIVLIFVQFSYSNLNDSSVVKKRAKFQFVMNPFFTKWDIPIGDYQKVASPQYGFATVELKYLSKWNFGIGNKTGYMIGTIDELKFLKYYEDEWFPDKNDILQTSRTVIFETGWNFYSYFFLYTNLYFFNITRIHTIQYRC